ncbi:hypothetical protein [Tsukamurella hominis]|uniref:hypothetical protein n=1 Tax=Tsukamurella hominis TaxID=1970232 RepID=UPI0039E8568F
MTAYLRRAPGPTPGATAWIRNVIVHPPISDGRQRCASIMTTRWDDYTAQDVRRVRLAGLRDASHDVHTDGDVATVRYRDGRVETITFHDAEPLLGAS